LVVAVVGRPEAARAVLDDFSMDASAARRELNWSPRDLFAGEIRRAVAEGR
jgi:nucleoside-diphosphate-sugar epimerase